MPNKYSYLKLFILMLFVEGCATIASPEGMTRFIEKYRNESIRGESFILDTFYKEAFQIADNLLRKNVIKADYETKVILCNFAADRYYLRAALVVYFDEVGNNQTKITLKGKMVASLPYLPQQIKDEVDLRKQGIRTVDHK